MNTTDKLEKIEFEIKKPLFLKNKGLSNEVGYYIFDYPPKDELLVRNFIVKMVSRNKPEKDKFKIAVYDVYDLMIDFLEKEDLMKECVDMEKDEGMHYLIKSVNGLLRLNEDSNYFAEYIEEHTPQQAVVFLTGIGKIFPFVRSHKILNNLHQVFDRSPVVMFYPGKYDGQTLQLFEELKDDNYYRAFLLVS